MTYTAETLTEDFSVISNSLDMQASFHAESERPRLLLLAPQWTHCLADLLQRYSSGELKVDIVGHPIQSHRTSCRIGEPVPRAF